MANSIETQCLRQKTGSCAGCPVLEIGASKYRWRGFSQNKTKEYLKSNYCPDGETPDLSCVINKSASFGMGQERHENTIGTVDIRPEKPTSRVSKSATGRWFWDK